MKRFDHGFTSSELMGTLAAFVLLAGGIYWMLSRQSTSYEHELHDLRSRRALKGALSFIKKELRQAGIGLSNCKGAVRRWDGLADKTRPTSLVALRVYNDCNLLSTPAERCPDESGADSFSVAYANDPAIGRLGSALLMAPMPTSTPEGPLLVRSAGHFRQGDRLILSARGSSGSSYCTLLRLTGAPRPLGVFYELPHAADGKLNPPAKINIFPPGGYARGSLVTRVSGATRIRYFAVDRRRPYPALVTWTRADMASADNAKAVETVAEGIEDLQLAWACDANRNGRYEEDHTHPRKDEWAHTRINDTEPECLGAPPGRVRLTLIARARAADPAFKSGHRPSAEDRKAGTTAQDQERSQKRGTFRRHTVSSIVNLINVVGAL
ncbi:MAG: hypothetical protein JRH20_26765 [Deltaproteobacteria bacterium]|nr:hypothetical protein [Deltaproteobacteria bacterium]